MRITTKLVRNLNDAVARVESLQDSERNLRAAVRDLIAAHYTYVHMDCPKHGSMEHTGVCCEVWRAKMVLAELEVDAGLPSTPGCCVKEKP